MRTRAGMLVAAGACVAVLAGCGGATYASAEELFEAAGGEAWCGGELRLSLPPWVGQCGPVDDAVVLGISPGLGELADGLNANDGDLLVLVPEDRDTLPGWQLRSEDAARLEAAREKLGGVILDGRVEIETWLGDDLESSPTASAGQR